MPELNRMPKPATLRKYYPSSTLTDEQLTALADWVRDYLGKQHISPENQILKALIKWEEKALIAYQEKEKP